MSTRREQLFASQNRPPVNILPATVNFKHNKKKGTVEPLQPHEKMLCALRKVLTEMSNKHPDGCRFYIADNQVQVLSAPTSTEAKEGQARTYKARGRFRLACSHGTHITSKMVEFSITYRDKKDDMGLDDIEWIDPTTLDELPKNTVLA